MVSRIAGNEVKFGYSLGRYPQQCQLSSPSLSLTLSGGTEEGERDFTIPAEPFTEPLVALGENGPTNKHK